MLNTLAEATTTSPEWVQLVTAFGAPGALAGVIVFLLRTVGTFLKDERAAQKEHHQELAKAQTALVDRVIEHAESIATTSQGTATVLKSAADTSLQVVSQAREVLRDTERFYARTKPGG